MLPSQAASGSDSAASPMAPLKIPIEVMPTWIVDRKLEGSWCRDSAASAPRLPSSARFWSLALREETTAISDMAKTPLIKMSTTRRNMSMLETALRSHRACGFGIEKRLIVAGVLLQASKLRRVESTGTSLAVLFPQTPQGAHHESSGFQRPAIGQP